MERRRSPVAREFTQNLQHHLFDRESGLNRRNPRQPPWRLPYEREFHKSITPNLTIQNVDKPLGFMRKFTPDGRLLLSFSQDQRSLEVYEYQGIASVANLLHSQSGECITAADHSFESLHIRQHIYERLLKLRWTLRLSSEMYPRSHVNREFSIFLDDGRYVLLSAMSVCNEQPPYDFIFRYPDLCDDCDVFAYTFIMVDLHLGRVTGVVNNPHDCIFLSHNQGISVYGRKIAILSKYRQCIDLLEMVSGKMVWLYSIGPFACELDKEMFFRVPEFSVYRQGKLPLGFLKQRILSYLYRDIIRIESLELRRSKLREFYRNFKIYENMVMMKMQLIDADHLLIRYEESRKNPEICDFDPRLKLYVFYAFDQQLVLKVYPSESSELLHLIRSFCDKFRNVRSLQTQRSSSSPSNNMYYRAVFDHTIQCLGANEAALRFNVTLPVSTQSFATSLYLDYSLFNYNDQMISALERPKLNHTVPIRFNDRMTNLTKFRIHLEPSAASTLPPTSSSRELVAYIFHPYEPFIISIQKVGLRYVVNFHLYNGSTVVKP